ncbi:hypothetical protein D3C72_2083000 [compost metagenome]
MQETGRMPQRCGHQEGIQPGEIEPRAVGTLAGQNIVVRQHHAFGFAFGTGGEQHRGQFIAMHADRCGQWRSIPQQLAKCRCCGCGG